MIEKLCMTLLLSLVLLLAGWCQLYPAAVVAATPTPPVPDQAAFTLTTDTPLLYGRPGETITYTLTLKNLGSIPHLYFISGEVSWGERFTLTGLAYGGNYSYHTTYTVPPQDQQVVEIGVKIPTHATNGLVHQTTVEAKATHTDTTALVQLVTVISVPTSIEPIEHLGIVPKDVFGQGAYAYVAAGFDGLRIIDVSQPDQPMEVGFYELPDEALGEVQSVAIAGHYAYLAAGLAGLRVVDISNPAAPFEAGNYTAAGIAKMITVAGNYAYVIWNKCNGCLDTLHIVDISNPAAPTGVSVYDGSTFLSDVASTGNYVYLAEKEGLQVLDVSNPALPFEAGFFEQDSPYSRIHRVAVANNYAYFNFIDRGLLILDISDPMAPVQANIYSTTSNIWDLAVVDPYVYVSNDAGEVRILNISNPTAPTESGIIKLPERSNNLTVTEIASNPTHRYAYLSTDSRGLRLVDVSDAAKPTELSSFGAPNLVEDVALAHHYAYVADGYDGLYVMDVTYPTTPTQIGLYNEHGGACEVEAVDHYVYAILGECAKKDYYLGYPGERKGDLYVLDVSSPSSPVEVARYDLPEGNLDGPWPRVEIWGNYAYLLDGASSLHQLDISNPAQPQRVNSTELTVRAFALANGYLYLVPPNGYALTSDRFTSQSRLDIVDPVTLAPVGSYQFAREYPALDVIVAGQRAYIYWYLPDLRGSLDGWLTLDISNPIAPTLIDTTLHPERAIAAVASDTTLYLANGQFGLHILDTSNPASPTQVDGFMAPGFASNVAVGKGYIYLANGSGGLYILRYPGAE